MASGTSAATMNVTSRDSSVHSTVNFSEQLSILLIQHRNEFITLFFFITIVQNERNVFCGQQCFKENYAQHKKIHTLFQQMADPGGGGGHRKTPPDGIVCPLDSPREVKTSLPTWAKSYNFTGDLRPALLSPRRLVTNPRVLPPDYATHPGGVSDSEQRDRASNNNIRVYGPDELEGECNLRYACAMGREVLDEGGKALRVGVTTDEIDRVIHEACMERDCYPSPLNYYNFPKSVCTSVNEIICHGIPDYREVQDGDIVNIDVTTFSRGGYHGDLNETFCVGNVDADGRRVVQTAFECLQSALAMVKPGTLYRDLGSTIHRVAAANKCSVVRTYCGHGIGELITPFLACQVFLSQLNSRNVCIERFSVSYSS
jgi:methionyl aminopeptidase